MYVYVCTLYIVNILVSFSSEDAHVTGDCLFSPQSVTSFGRQMIDQSKALVEKTYCIRNGYRHDAKVCVVCVCMCVCVRVC